MKLRFLPTVKAALLSCVAVTVLCAQSLMAADKVTLEQRLPADVFLYVSVPDVDTFSSKYKETSFYKIYENENVQKFCTQITDKISEGLAESGVELSLDDLLSIASGEVSFAIFKPSTQPLAVVAAIEFGDSKSQVDTILEKIISAAEAEGTDVTEEEVDGATLNIIEPPQTNPQVPVEQRAIFCIKDSTIMFSNSAVAIKDILSSWEGKESDSFEKSAIYSQVKSECVSESGSSVMNFFIDPMSMIQALAMSAGPQGMQLQMGIAMMQPLGIANLKGIGSCSEILVGDFESVSKSLIVVEPEATGLLNVFRFPATAQKPADWVTDDVTSFQAVNWDAQAAFDAVSAIVDSFQGPGFTEQILNGVAQNPNGPGVHVKKDVIDQLSGNIQFVTKAGSGGGIQAMQSLLLLGAGVNDEEGMKDVLSRVAESPGFPGEAREFEGAVLYEMINPNPSAPTIAFAVAKGYLFFATEVELLEAALRGDSEAKKLADSDAYKKLAEHFPSETSLIGFSDPKTQIQPIYDEFRSGQLGMLIPDLDFSLLPEFEEIAEHFGTAASYMVPTDNGAKAVQFQLKN